MQVSKRSRTVYLEQWRGLKETWRRSALLGQGHWNQINGNVQMTFQGETQRIQRHRNMERAVRVVGWQIVQYSYSGSCVGPRADVTGRVESCARRRGFTQRKA